MKPTLIQISVEQHIDRHTLLREDTSLAQHAFDLIGPTIEREEPGTQISLPGSQRRDAQSARQVRFENICRLRGMTFGE